MQKRSAESRAGGRANIGEAHQLPLRVAIDDQFVQTRLGRHVDGQVVADSRLRRGEAEKVCILGAICDLDRGNVASEVWVEAENLLIHVVQEQFPERTVPEFSLNCSCLSPVAVFNDHEATIFPDVDLDTDDPEAKVSRRHARITLSNGQYFLEDLGSTNGTFINRGKRLPPGQRQALCDGDEIIVGKTFLRFHIVK